MSEQFRALRMAAAHFNRKKPTYVGVIPALGNAFDWLIQREVTNNENISVLDFEEFRPQAQRCLSVNRLSLAVRSIASPGLRKFDLAVHHVVEAGAFRR
ncbi:hypothetical protein PY650_33705 [Rhizobium calliandrae]|uniref:Uncharacterized protein n=1 Tax=Rhizobium calliandrae TaxID=1312182 RepID=A0ABT7KSH9_9HYPH|nr:hypothetical protein [Rhizobium calliandrae]MDL2410453.1 hypothetical protein [Rhizobium calliandrae]